MNSTLLARALRERAEKVEEHVEDVGEGERWHRRDNAELLRVLARVVEGQPVVRAFGAPGDWGYSHPIGKALAAKPEGLV